jgi:DNA polymerase-1
MIDVDQWLLGRESEIRMLLQVHDELVFEVREDCVDQYRE